MNTEHEKLIIFLLSHLCLFVQQQQSQNMRERKKVAHSMKSQIYMSQKRGRINLLWDFLKHIREEDFAFNKYEQDI